MKSKAIRYLALTAAAALTLSTVLSPAAVHAAPETAVENGSTAGQNSITAGQNGSTAGQSSSAVGQNGSDNGQAAEVIHIATAEDMLALSENCRTDAYSMGKTFSLDEDIRLLSDFRPIASFNGTFFGNGHTIDGFSLTADGSGLGLFRYVGTSGKIYDLNVTGVLTPGGSAERIGGIVGENSGLISFCEFSGVVKAKSCVGGIVGRNRLGGIISNCKTKSGSLISGSENTGGIAGENLGILCDCFNSAGINTDEQISTLDLGGFDVGSLNLAAAVSTRTNTGGIAGLSSGTISGCQNDGRIGYEHVGYNIGGIAGCQSGTILDCRNMGLILGRKDAAGIVGQAEPFLEKEHLSDMIDETREQVHSLGSTIDAMADSISETSSELNDYTDSLSTTYNDTLDNVRDLVDDLDDELDDNDSEQGRYVEEIRASLDHIDEINKSHSITTDDGLSIQEIKGAMLTDADKKAIRREYQSINDNLGNLKNSYKDSSNDVQNSVDLVSDELKKGRENSSADIEDFADTIDRGIQTFTDQVKTLTTQTRNVGDTVSNHLNVISDDDKIRDISSGRIDKNAKGVISGSVNTGNVRADLNAGGIIGAMNVELDIDPEEDADFSLTTDLTVRTTASDVVLHCSNYGVITTKRNNSGGIAGQQELGLIYDCQGYGDIFSENGSYMGGIAGYSASSVQNSCSFCHVEGSGFLGGIAGYGYTIQDCLSIPSFTGTGEAIGSIAGDVNEKGILSGNYYQNDTVFGVDNISYTGMAEGISYEQMINKEQAPEGFRKVTVLFIAATDPEDADEEESEETSSASGIDPDDFSGSSVKKGLRIPDEYVLLNERNIAYGGSVSRESLPKIPQIDGYYAVWDEDLPLDSITDSMTIAAHYIKWNESLSSDVQVGDVFSEEKIADQSTRNCPLMLLSGKFYEDSSLKLSAPDEAPGNLLPGTLLYQYRVELIQDAAKDDQLQVHTYLPPAKGEHLIYLLRENSWQKLSMQADGSYGITDIPNGSVIAVVEMPMNYTAYILAGAGLLILLLLLLNVRAYKKIKKKRDAKKAAK